MFGASSGGALALEAAAAGAAVETVAVYEVPYSVADDAPARWRGYVESLEAVLAEARRGDAVELFMRLAGSSDEDVASARSWPGWAGLEAIAHTLAYDAACLGDLRPPLARLATISQQVLVATGGTSFGPAADAMAASIPQAERRIFEGQGHVVDPKVLGPALARFITR